VKIVNNIVTLTDASWVKSDT